jgi:hypothetical protein
VAGAWTTLLPPPSTNIIYLQFGCTYLYDEDDTRNLIVVDEREWYGRPLMALRTVGADRHLNIYISSNHSRRTGTF